MQSRLGVHGDMDKIAIGHFSVGALVKNPQAFAVGFWK
jgi:hypothetical protein